MANKKNGRTSQETLTKQAAIAAATAQVTPLLEIEAGRWTYHVWSERQGAWIPALRTDAYGEARRKRLSTIAAMAADLLVRNGTDNKNEQLALKIIGLAYSKDSTGSVATRVNQILERLH